MSAVAASPSPAPAPRSRASVRQAWIDRLARFDASGKSVVAFCASEGVSQPSFYWWKRRLATQPGSSTTPRQTEQVPAAVLLPVRVAAPNSVVELVLPCGATLRLVPGCDLTFVRSLVDALGGPPC